MKVLVMAFFSIVLLVGCQSSKEIEKGAKIYIAGDSKAVGAEIYIDGQKVGLMEKRVYSGSNMSDEEIMKQHDTQQKLGIEATKPMEEGDIFSIGVDIRSSNVGKKSEYSSYNDIRVPNGKHEILFKSKDGKALKKVIVIQGESYIAVSFTTMQVQGGS